jgi:hypothetical protein
VTEGIEEVVYDSQDRPPCASCHLPFGFVDICVIVLPPDAEGEPVGFYHIPCYEQAAALAPHVSVVGLTFETAAEKQPEFEDAARQVDEFAEYVDKHARGEVAELEDDEIEARWPTVERLISAQRATRRGGVN